MNYNLGWPQRGIHSLFYLVPENMCTEEGGLIKGSGGKAPHSPSFKKITGTP